MSTSNRFTPTAIRENTRMFAERMLREGFVLGEDRRECVVEVHDEAGTVLLELTLEDAVGGPEVLASLLN
jgi:hypothetical protein